MGSMEMEADSFAFAHLLVALLLLACLAVTRSLPSSSPPNFSAPLDSKVPSVGATELEPLAARRTAIRYPSTIILAQ